MLSHLLCYLDRQDIPRIVNNNIQSDFPHNVYLFIIAGTSLTVSPACYLINKVHHNVPKILINNELVGDVDVFDGDVYDSHHTLVNNKLTQIISCEHNNNHNDNILRNDITTAHTTLLGECDEGFLVLSHQLGWLKEIYSLTHNMCDKSKHLIELYGVAV